MSVTTLKIVIAGSRTINDYTKLVSAMEVAKSKISPNAPIAIVSGGASGVDTLALRYAREQKLVYYEFKPQYAGPHDRAAPLRRNMDMAAFGDILVAVWDGSSTGTAHMISCMKQLGKPVYVHDISKSY